MTTEAGSRPPLLFGSDGTTFVVDIASNASVCNDSFLFIGPIIDSIFSLDAANVNRGLGLNTFPIRIAWQDDNWETLSYEFKDVVYNPSSPFSIMYVGRIGQNFGIIYSLPTNYEEGAWVKSCASYTNLTWYHGRFTRQFDHSSDHIPELSVNTGS